MVTTNTPSMKAICFHEYGGPEVLKYENVPRPEPQHGQVLIQVRAAAVNPVDWKIREGWLASMIPLQLPAIAGATDDWPLERICQAVGQWSNQA